MRTYHYLEARSLARVFHNARTPNTAVVVGLLGRGGPHRYFNDGATSQITGDLGIDPNSLMWVPACGRGQRR